MTRSDRPPLYTPVPGRRSRPANRQPSTINHLRLGLLVLLLLPAAALRGQTALDEAERLQFADGLYARDMHDLALQEYAALLRDFPGSTNAAVVHFRMAETYRRSGKLAEADAAYRRVFEDYPGSPVRLKAGLKRAELSLEGRQYQTAADRFRLVLNEKPPPAVAAPAFYFLGTALQKLGRSREAADAFEQAQRRYPSSSYRSYALLALGDLYGDGQGAWRGEAQAVQQALECYRLAAEQPATERVGAEALFQAAEIRFRRGEFAESAEAYARLLARYPGDTRCAEASLQAAWAAHNAGRYADSLRAAAAALQPGAAFTNRAAEAEWIYVKANSERQLAQYAAAAQSYAQLIERFPACRFAPAARYEKALTFYRQQRFADAAAELETCAPPAGLEKDVHWLLAESYAALKAPEKAAGHYRRIVLDFPASDVAGDAAYRLARGLQEGKAYGEAARFYGWVVTNRAQSALVPQALLAAGLCRASQNDHAGAVNDWALLIRRFPASPAVEDALYQKAISEMRLKRDADATASLRQYVAQFPTGRAAAEAHYWLGALSKEAEQWPAAEAALRQALKCKPGEDLDREIRFHLANVLQQSGRPAEAAELYNALLASPLRSRFPPAMLAWLAEYTFDQKNVRESVAAARQLVANSREPNWQQIGWGLVGRGELAAGNRPAAVAALRNCLAVKATTRFAAESALRLGDILRADRDATNAAAYYAEAARLAASDALLEIRARAYAGLGATATLQDDAENAGKYFLSVAILYDDPELVPECLYEAAQAFRTLGRTNEAAKALKELNERFPESKWAKRGAAP